jgi:prevent-host-death family protein
MDTLGSYEAKTHLPALLERVQKGERITITKHGVPVAVLVPVEPKQRRSREEAIEAMRAFGRGRSLPEGMTLKKMIEEGRRY